MPCDQMRHRRYYKCWRFRQSAASVACQPETLGYTMWLSRDCAHTCIYLNHQAEWFIGGLRNSRKYSIHIIRSHEASLLHPCSLWNTLKMKTVIFSKCCHLCDNVHSIKPQKTGIIFYNIHKLQEYSALRDVGKRNFFALKFLQFSGSYMEINFSSYNRGLHLSAVNHKAPPPPDPWNTEVTHVGIYFLPLDRQLCLIYIALTSVYGVRYGMNKIRWNRYIFFKTFSAR